MRHAAHSDTHRAAIDDHAARAERVHLGRLAAYRRRIPSPWGCRMGEPCRMTLQERFDLIRSVGEECIQVYASPQPSSRQRASHARFPWPAPIGGGL